MRNRDERRRPERLSDRLRRDTERKWHEDPYSSSAGDMPGAWLDEDEDQD